MAENFVRWFRQVAPYVHDFGGRTFVVAFGGELVAERARFASFIHDINVLASLEIRLVLVHGARLQIEAELKRQGSRSKYAPVRSFCSRVHSRTSALVACSSH